MRFKNCGSFYVYCWLPFSEPLPPKKLTIRFIGRTSAVISWKHSRCYSQISPIATFKLLLTERGGNVTQFLPICTGYKRSHRFCSLKPCTTYSVKVAAMNKQGTSGFTPPQVFTTNGSKCANRNIYRNLKNKWSYSRVYANVRNITSAFDYIQTIL